MDIDRQKILTYLSIPTPNGLWLLRGDLYEAGLLPSSPTADALRHFYTFLVAVESAVSTKHYTEVASLLDISAVGAVAIQNLISRDMNAVETWERLILGAASEALLLLASRQYIKAAHSDLVRCARHGAWDVYDDLWLLSREMKPDMPDGTRRQQIDELLAFVFQGQGEALYKIIAIGRIFQVLLISRLGLGK